MAVGEQGYSRDANINECISPRKYLYRIKRFTDGLAIEASWINF